MEDRLSGIGIIVCHQSEAALGKAPLSGDLRGDTMKMPDQLVVFRRQIECIYNMFSRYQQQMQRRCRVDILDNHQLFILADHLCRYLTGDYLAENTGHCPPLLSLLREFFQINEEFPVTLGTGNW